MRSVRTRIGAVAIVLATIGGGLLLSQGAPAGASTVQYTCSGTTNDLAARMFDYYNIFTGQTVYKNVSTATFMSTLGSTINQLAPGSFVVNPVISADVSISAPSTAAPGSIVNPTLNASLTLPDNLVADASHYLGVSSLVLRNSTIAVNGTQASPSTITSGIPNQTVPLTAGTTVQATATGPMTVTGSSGLMAFSPGKAHVELLLDPTTYPNGKHITQVVYNGTTLPIPDFYIYGLRFDCTPSAVDLAFTTIQGGTTTTTTTSTSTTTTTQPTTTTTSTSTTTTTQPTTTTTSTSTTTTTQPTTTTTSTTTTTTTQPTTTTTSTTTTAPSTTTTTVPSGNADLATITVSGYGYANAGALTSGNFVVKSGSTTGGGTLPGVNGGSATVSVNVNQFLFWGFGTVTVSDPGAGLPSTTGYVLFGPAPSRNVSGSGFTFANGAVKNYTVSLRITDLG
jgi:hypothetical protein